METKRTDLAAEARSLWQQSSESTAKLEGVEAFEETIDGFAVETVKILDGRGSKALGKPEGTYVTVNFEPKRRDELRRCAAVLQKQLQKLLRLDPKGRVLIAGLGNPKVTPDELGPETVSRLLITRHLIKEAPEYFGNFRSVSAVKTGVLGTTGVESAELLSAAAEKLKPAAVIVIDALASASPERVCRTVQLSDTGIVPGSGVGNDRAAISQKTLGVPVIAVGVPTVIDAASFSESSESRGMMVTPREIDSLISECSRLTAYGINLALHEQLSLEEIEELLE